MIKLIDILKEIYVNSQGDIIGEADFVVKQTGYSDLILVDKEKININEYVYFQANYNTWNTRKIANTIFKQVMELYKGTSLEKYNNTVGFIPSKRINRDGGAFDLPSLDLSLMKGVLQFTSDKRSIEKWAPAPLEIEIPIDKEEYTLEGRTFPNLSKLITGFDRPISIGPKEKAKITTSKEDIEDKLMYLDIIYIPYLAIPQWNKSDRPKMSAEKKVDIVNVFNEVGLEAFSYLENKTK